MKINRLFIVVWTSIVMVVVAGCDNFLDVESDTQKIGESEGAFDSYDELRKATAFLYTVPWYNWANTNMFILGDARGNNVYNDGQGTLTEYACFIETGSTSGMSQGWCAMYNVITQADYIINNYAPSALPYVEEEEIEICIGEAKFMRGLAYWYLAMYWHDVPIIESPMDYTWKSSAYSVCFEDVLQYAIYDLEEAVKYLPESDVAGRVTKYSAEGILARLYLTVADFVSGGYASQIMLERYEVTSARELAIKLYTRVKELARDVIDNGKQYGLMDDYEQIFRVQNNNCKEVLFALQYVQGIDDYGLGNGNQGFAGYSKELTDNITGGGGSNHVSYDIALMYVEDGAWSRARGNVFFDGQIYDYLGTHTQQGNWTVGYIDGVRKNTTKCKIKKQCIGSKEDAGGIILSGNSGFKTPMLRIAEVYLMCTEACIRLKNLNGEMEELIISKSVDSEENAILLESEDGIEEFFKVRKRAYGTDMEAYQEYLNTKDKITLNDLYKEYRLELFMEGLWWQTLLRRSFYDSWVLRFLNNEFRQAETGSDNYGWSNFAGYAYTYDVEKEDYKKNLGFSNDSPRANSVLPLPVIKHNMSVDDWVHSPTADDNLWAYPYPIAEITEDPYLDDRPVRYDFSKYK